MEITRQAMAAATPAKLRVDTTAQPRDLRVVLTQTATIAATAATARSQDLKAAMMETQCVAMVAATPAKLRADTTAKRLVPPAALIPTLTARATAATARSQDLKAAMMETQCVAMAAATPAKLRADTTAQPRDLRVVLTQTATIDATAAMALAGAVRTVAAVLVTVVGAGRTVAMALATAVTARTATPVPVTVVGVRTAAMEQSPAAKSATIATPQTATVAVAPAKLRVDGTAQRLVPPVALMPTLTARATVMNQHAGIARSQGLKPATMGTRALVMGAATRARLKADTTAQPPDLRVVLT